MHTPRHTSLSSTHIHAQPHAHPTQACEGFPIDLAAVAVDDNANEDVRIYMEDKDVDLSLYPAGSQPYKIQGGIDNSDFFHLNLSREYRACMLLVLCVLIHEHGSFSCHVHVHAFLHVDCFTVMQ